MYQNKLDLDPVPLKSDPSSPLEGSLPSHAPLPPLLTFFRNSPALFTFIRDTHFHFHTSLPSSVTPTFIFVALYFRPRHPPIFSSLFIFPRDTYLYFRRSSLSSVTPTFIFIALHISSVNHPPPLLFTFIHPVL